MEMFHLWQRQNRIFAVQKKRLPVRRRKKLLARQQRKRHA
jgi:hypothetical protein